MRLIWTKSNLPLSVLIRWGLKEPVSHFAIVFDDFLVFQSNLLGVGMTSLDHFLNSGNAKIVFEKNVPLPLDQEEHIYKDMINKYAGSGYDWGAFFYFMWRAFLKRVFLKPLAGKNIWGSKSAMLCTEMYDTLPAKVVTDEQKAQLGDLGLVSPYQLWLKVKE